MRTFYNQVRYAKLVIIILALLAMLQRVYAQVDSGEALFIIPAADLHVEASKRAQFLQYNHDYYKEIVPRLAKAKTLSKRVFANEKAGLATACSHQILYENEWLLSSTADFKRIDQRLDDLEKSLSDPPGEALAEQQDPTDGSWGACSTEWFFKLNAFYDAFQNLPDSDHLKYAPAFLDRINSPEKLTAYLTSIATSNIPLYGVDHRRELNESLANLLRLVLHDKPANYKYHPKLKATLMKLVLGSLRSPTTGYWGERYINGDSMRFVDDLSITFHMISYLNGKISGWEKVIAHTLAVKNTEYPVGWLHNNQYENHHNMDVVTIFKLGWQYTTPLEKQMISSEIQAMLNWCLAQSLQPDGSVKITEDDDSVEEGTYFGISFLCRIGYFDKAARFWTTQNFAGAEEMRKKIITNILQHKAAGAAGGTYYNTALQQLGYKQ